MLSVKCQFNLLYGDVIKHRRDLILLETSWLLVKSVTFMIASKLSAVAFFNFHNHYFVNNVDRNVNL